LAAVKKLLSSDDVRCVPYNLGTGTGTTVLEMVHALEEACDVQVPVRLAARRKGDVPAVWAATEAAERELGWKAKLTIKDMCRDQWAWVRKGKLHCYARASCIIQWLGQHGQDCTRGMAARACASTCTQCVGC